MHKTTGFHFERHISHCHFAHLCFTKNSHVFLPLNLGWSLSSCVDTTERRTIEVLSTVDKATLYISQEVQCHRKAWELNSAEKLETRPFCSKEHTQCSDTGIPKRGMRYELVSLNLQVPHHSSHVLLTRLAGVLSALAGLADAPPVCRVLFLCSLFGESSATFDAPLRTF